MKTKYIIYLALVLSACNISKPEKETLVQTNSVLNQYLTNDKILKFDTLFVTYTDNEKDKSKFIGDSMFAEQTIKLPKSLQVENNFLGFYYCGTLIVDDSTKAILIRTPSTYVSSSIKLFIYNQLKDTIVNYYELADELGDAGYSYRKVCKLFKNSKNKLELVFTESHTAYNISEDKMESNYMLNYNCTLNQNQLDTISKNKINL
jgi:hypothetical protein